MIMSPNVCIFHQAEVPGEDPNAPEIPETPVWVDPDEVAMITFNYRERTGAVIILKNGHRQTVRESVEEVGRKLVGTALSHADTLTGFRA
jgi:hypothetical protein